MIVLLPHVLREQQTVLLGLVAGSGSGAAPPFDTSTFLLWSRGPLSVLHARSSVQHATLKLT